MIGEGALPGCAQVRAVEHERQRVKALPIRERAEPPAAVPGEAGDFGNLMSKLTEVPSSMLPSLPIKDALKDKASLPEISPKPGAEAQRPRSMPANGTPVGGAVPAGCGVRVLAPDPPRLAPTNLPTFGPGTGCGN